MTRLSGTDVKIVVEQIERIAERRGYQRAIAALRDDERYRAWWSLLREDDPDFGYWERGRRELADYLESVYPEVSVGDEQRSSITPPVSGPDGIAVQR